MSCTSRSASINCWRRCRILRRAMEVPRRFRSCFNTNPKRERGPNLAHDLLKYTRKIDLFIVMCGPVLFALALDLLDTQKLSWQAGHWRAYLAGYTVICWIVGFGIAPICEIFYLLRRQAPQLVKETAET